VRRRVVAVVALLLVVSLASPAVATTPPGSLPQTNAEPSFGAPLTQSMRQLVVAIADNSASLALREFFPEGAYLQMKTGSIPYPSSDYKGRLVAFFRLDVAAYHAKVFGAQNATFLRVEVNARVAQWIPIGGCENKIGYWHVPGVRLVFQRGHQVVSVAVASLISWRGVWYVVHLGPNPRPANVGTVDNYRVGPGTPGPAGGC
jgi:hypothetical protein